MKQHVYPAEAVIEQRASELHIRICAHGLSNLLTTSSGQRVGVADQRYAPPTEIITCSRAPSDLRFA